MRDLWGYGGELILLRGAVTDLLLCAVEEPLVARPFDQSLEHAGVIVLGHKRVRSCAYGPAQEETPHPSRSYPLLRKGRDSWLSRIAVRSAGDSSYASRKSKAPNLQEDLSQGVLRRPFCSLTHLASHSCKRTMGFLSAIASRISN